MAEKNCSTELSREELLTFLVYCSVTGIFRWKVDRGGGTRAGSVAGRIDGSGCQQISINGKRYKAHRLVWLYVHGVWPSAEIDHINRVRTDNRIENLREASHAENMRNLSKAKNNTSGHVGVHWDKRRQKWVAYIKHERRRIHLGYYTHKEDAIAARKAGEIRYWGVARAE